MDFKVSTVKKKIQPKDMDTIMAEGNKYIRSGAKRCKRNIS